MTDSTFKFHVRTISWGWSEIVMYINEKEVSFHASYIGNSPIETLIDACAELESCGDNYYIQWETEPGIMKIELELLEHDVLKFDITKSYGDDDKTEFHETVKFEDFKNAIMSEGFRVLNAFGLWGYRMSWMDHKDFPLTNLLRITGKCNEVWKGDACSTDIFKEIGCLQEFLVPTAVTDELKIDECAVYYESWQLQCCGQPFAVGDKVEWTGILPNEYKNAHGILIDFEEEHHGFATLGITGTVTKIISERSRFKKGEREASYVKANCLHEELDRADGHESVHADNDEAVHTFWGYIVFLKDVTVKPITEDVEYGRK